MDLDVTFNGTTMKTSIYVKPDAPEQLLLAESVQAARNHHVSPECVGCSKGGKVVSKGTLVEAAD